MQMVQAMMMVLAGALVIAAGDPAPVNPPTSTPIRIWPNGAPGSAARAGEPEIARDYWVRNIHDPTVLAFPAPARHNSGAAMVILPGGAHEFLV